MSIHTVYIQAPPPLPPHAAVPLTEMVNASIDAPEDMEVDQELTLDPELARARHDFRSQVQTFLFSAHVHSSIPPFGS